MKNIPTIGISDFALDRHFDKKGFTYTTLTPDQLSKLIKDNWNNQQPGTGEINCTRKLLVSVPPKNDKGEVIFFTPYALLKEGMEFRGFATRRQAGEDLYEEMKAINGDLFDTEEVKFVKIVLYSKEALLENDGICTTNCDFEVVAIIASSVENEPMQPLTLARNFLEKTGGTKSIYTAQEFAESIYYWSQRVKLI
jgi:hypothetical protein